MLTVFENERLGDITPAELSAFGAGVPRPCNAKRANESSTPGTPAMMSASPTRRVVSAARKGGRNSQCVIDHGMTPANIVGATRKNSAEPRIAVIFDMRPPVPVAMLLQLCPVSAFSG
jgi:hypothetical protein